jgi:hypothetical protein
MLTKLANAEEEEAYQASTLEKRALLLFQIVDTPAERDSHWFDFILTNLHRGNHMGLCVLCGSTGFVPDTHRKSRPIIGLSQLFDPENMEASDAIHDVTIRLSI